jgi:hypothetical protein
MSEPEGFSGKDYLGVVFVLLALFVLLVGLGYLGAVAVEVVMAIPPAGMG